MLRVGIDVGGTFTDLFAWDPTTKTGCTAKVLTTKQNLTEGVLNALVQAEIDPADIGVFVHGSTTATNALIERSYPQPALITTEGFRDTIEIGRQRRAHLYDPYQQKPAPLIRRRNRYTVAERIRADGTVRTELDEGRVREIAALIRGKGIRSVAVAFINSYANAQHELRTRDILEEEIPGVKVAMSSDLPKFRELGRFVTAAVRAALLPVMGDYLEQLEGDLEARGFRGVFYVIKSNGGVMRASAAKGRPEELIESGPAGGVAAAQHVAAQIGESELVSTDMGGTSFDVCLIEGGRGLVSDSYQLEWDMPIIVPMLDIRSIGSGGGSIAWLDEGGSLRVGPRSAGSSPGPACYGLGGTDATVTDANLLLGRLDPTLGGKFPLDREAAARAVGGLADRLGMDLLRCAEGIVQICAENMASAIKMVSIDRGRDPRDFSMVSFGGAGAMHAWAIAPSAGIDKIIVPPFAGVASAFGATVMDVRHDVEATYYMACDGADLAVLNAKYKELEDSSLAMLEGEGFAREQVEIIRTAGMRYVGQSYEVSTPIPAEAIDSDSLRDIVASFHVVHRQEHGVASDIFGVAFVNLRVTAVGKVEKPELDTLNLSRGVVGVTGDSPSKGSRDVYFDGRFVSATILRGDMLLPGYVVEGPSIIEYADAEIVVPPSMTAQTDAHGNVLITVNQARG